MITDLEQVSDAGM